MVFRSISFWSAPRADQEDEFEVYYEMVHAPFAARVPGLLKLSLMKAGTGLEGSPAGFYRVAEVWFENERAFHGATATQEWLDMRENGEHVQKKFDVTLTSGLGEIFDFPLDPGGLRPETAEVD